MVTRDEAGLWEPVRKVEAEAQSGNFLLKIITSLREQGKAAEVLPG